MRQRELKYGERKMLKKRRLVVEVMAVEAMTAIIRGNVRIEKRGEIIVYLCVYMSVPVCDKV